MKTTTPAVVIAPGILGTTIARSLGRLGVPMIGVFSNARSPSRRSRYWTKTYVWDVQASSAELSFAFLSSLARDAPDKPVLLSTDDDTCLFIARHARILREWYRFPDQPEGLPEHLSSKRGMYQLCEQHGIPTAATVFPDSLADVEAYITSGAFPVMLKAIDTQALQRRAGLRMMVVEDGDSLRHWYTELETPESPNLMIQELIPGDSSAVWMFNGYFDADSRCLFGMTGQKLRQYPAYTGATSLGVCMPNSRVSDLTMRFMADLEYRGILDIGYKYDIRTGEYKLLDVNPRIGATFRLFVDSAGMDVARAMYCDLTGQAVVTGQHIAGRKWMSEAFDVASSWRYYRDGKISFRRWLTSFRGVKEGMWFASDDPAPLISLLGYGIRHFSRRRFSGTAQGGFTESHEQSLAATQ